jgi:hypothetical protein
MVASDTVITLKGSVEIVSEFFFTAINSILYQRGEFINLLFHPEKSPFAAAFWSWRLSMKLPSESISKC